MPVPLYPLTFTPLFQERLWGSRRLAELYGKALPSNLPIGESWEISDRPEAMSVVDQGPLTGRTLHDLVAERGPDLLGDARAVNGRFPLLLKILDAAEKLSLQVHPPESAARELQGDPKTELWYVTAAAPAAELYVGLRRGVSREGFEERLRTGTVAECFHRVPVQAGSAMFVPSGRVHGIGAGCIIFEIQQNSDTTYRVFDWNRTGADGKPRALHVAQSLQSINFDDIEPGAVESKFEGTGRVQRRALCRCPFFEVDAVRLGESTRLATNGRATMLAVSRGDLVVPHANYVLRLKAGNFCLLPAALGEVELSTPGRTEFLVIRAL